MELIINIPPDRLQALNDHSKKENLTAEEIVNKLIARYLLIKTMDKMQDEVKPKLKDMDISSEEDILNMK
jgi:uncharacterized protein YnzC (UPF0291/DUF896 family)